MKIVLSVLGTLLVVVALAVGLVYSGLYNVAATEPHHPLVRWILETATARSIAVRADAVGSSDIGAASLVEEGARHYRVMCETCHGGPDAAPSGIGKGLRPAPPDLARTAGAMPTERIFWIVKHGIKMTGMPAWGETHDDRALWAIVAFVKRLPALSPEQYRAMGRPAGGAGHGPAGSHGHTPGGSE